MIGSTRNLRVWAYAAPADLRKGFDGLSGLVGNELGRDVLSGDCFLFVSRSRRTAKVLVWDGTGLCIYHKRLEQGRFPSLWSEATSGPVVLMQIPRQAEHPFRSKPNTDSDGSRTPIPSEGEHLFRLKPNT